jgi:hypothetical protein
MPFLSDIPSPKISPSCVEEGVGPVSCLTAQIAAGDAGAVRARCGLSHFIVMAAAVR